MPSMPCLDGEVVLDVDPHAENDLAAVVDLLRAAVVDLLRRPLATTTVPRAPGATAPRWRGRAATAR